MDKDYEYGSAAIGGQTIASPPSKDSVDTLVRTLADRLTTLANEVISMSERIHGANGVSGGGGGVNAAIPSWADELRVGAGQAHGRGEYAMKEIYHIRETLGL